MSEAGIPVAPRVLQDLLLASRACRVLGAAAEPVELWEAYALAQVDAGLRRRRLRPGAHGERASRSAVEFVQIDPG